MALFNIEVTARVRVQKNVWAPSKKVALEWAENHEWDISDGDADDDFDFAISKEDGDRDDAEVVIDRDGNEI